MTALPPTTAPPSPQLGVAARIAALAVASAALACLGASGGLRPALVPAAAVAMTLADLLTSNRSPRVDALLRNRVMPVALVLCAGPALVGLAHAAGDPELVRGAGARLAAGALVVMPLAGSTRRDLLARLALATATAGLATAAAGAQVLLPGLVFLVAALALLALVEHERLAARIAATTVRSPAVARRPIGAAVLALVVTATVAVSLGRVLDLPTPHAPSGNGTPRSGSTSGTSSASDPGNRLDTASGYLDLRQRGQLPDGPVALVSSPDPLLWRSGWLTVYDGHSWQVGPDGSDPLRPPAGGVRRSDVVSPLGSSRSVLLSPGDPVALDPRPSGYDGSGTFAMPDRPYSVASVQPVLDTADRTPVADATSDDPTPDPTTLSLPSVPVRVVDLARRLTAGATTRAEAVDAVVSYLRQTYRYRLDSPAPPAGADAVDDFLFRSREGFCEQFASAAAVLLREVGVPTRLAVGYADGEPDAGGRLLRGTDAHAWIEVYFPRSGWVAFDPTAGAVRADGAGHSWRSWLTDRGSSIAILALVGVAGGVAVWFGVSAIRRRRRERHLDPLARALRRLDRRLGARRRRPDETLREFAERLPFDADTRAAVLVAENDRYAAEGADPELRLRAARRLRRPVRVRRRRRPAALRR